MALHQLKQPEELSDGWETVARLYLVVGVGASRPRGVPLIRSTQVQDVSKVAVILSRQLSLRIVTRHFDRDGNPISAKEARG